MVTLLGQEYILIIPLQVQNLQFNTTLESKILKVTK